MNEKDLDVIMLVAETNFAIDMIKIFNSLSKAKTISIEQLNNILDKVSTNKIKTLMDIDNDMSNFSAQFLLNKLSEVYNEKILQNHQ